jgi:hypothetical protein
MYETNIIGVYAKMKHLFAKGRTVLYQDPDYPEGIVKEYPDGHRELVTWVNDQEIFLREL